MKKGETYSGVITRVDFMNKGIALCENGENVTVKNTLPGQTVTFRINKKRGGRCEGRLISVDEKSYVTSFRNAAAADTRPWLMKSSCP